MSMREIDNRFKRFFHRKKRGALTPWDVDPSGEPSVLVRSLVFFGIICIISGAWCCSQAEEPFHCVGEMKKYKLPAIILLYDGSMLLALGLVTICASATMLRLVLISLCQILYVCLVLESIAGALSVAMDTTAQGEAIYYSLMRNVELLYGREPLVSFAIDKMQVAFNCCGVDGPENWVKSLWARDLLVKDPEGPVPLSCCAEDGLRCNKVSGSLRKKGCLKSARMKIRQYLRSVSRCALSCVFLHLTLCLAGLFLEGKG